MDRRETILEQGAWSWPYRNWRRDSWRSLAFGRLDTAFDDAVTLSYTDSSRFVLFSDLHRGDGGSTDRFAPNKELFLKALRYYYENGFTYVEVGDGDELWLHDTLQPIPGHMKGYTFGTSDFAQVSSQKPTKAAD